ncbi:methionyl-tRNA formyltransferase [Campylobacter sp. MIT 97-5078]|uniref:methionyl-tRNA formyltransferase n=1 Tax=Campylobacter sp. MIT 97-5078 TaxID=1548153 RepID=UPI0009DD6607|nr:formyltransferase family protein [Campylobacter sp. MIT 97-5078]TQR27645.1 methionyl-tRNA formyltransferase [Campylobacter sp. MIT 97-5078]
MQLNIGYFADGKWAYNCFLKIISHQDMSIKFIVLRYKNPDLNLIKLAKKHKIPIFIVKNINDENFIKEILTFKPNLLVSMSFDQIFKADLLDYFKNKIINCHAGKLPFYRGKNILNWVLINDEKEFGISVHFVDLGIDTGDIILQKCFTISDKDDYSSLLKKAHRECANVLFEALKLFVKGAVRAKKQGKIGFYCPARIKGDEFIDFHQSSRECFNFIRALNALDLGAKAFIEDKIITIFKSKLIKAPHYKGIEGAVVGLEKDHFLVKTKDSVLKITAFHFEGQIKIGHRLKASPQQNIQYKTNSLKFDNGGGVLNSLSFILKYLPREKRKCS